MLIAMIGVMLPSSFLAYSTAKWVRAHQNTDYVIAFKQGLAPMVIGAILATSWIISSASDDLMNDWPLWLCTSTTVLLIWKTQIHILLLLAIGAGLGVFGVI